MNKYLNPNITPTDNYLSIGDSDTYNETDVYESMIEEAIKSKGQVLYYLPRQLLNVDKFLVDDIPSRFAEAHAIEMYVNVQGYEGEGDIFGKWGMEIRDESTFYVSKKRFIETLGDNEYIFDGFPNAGDLIYVPFSKSLFEIKRVERESTFYQLNKLMLYELHCELFEYSGEDFSVEASADVPAEQASEINAVEKLGYTFNLTIDGDLSSVRIGTHVEQMFGGEMLTGKVVDVSGDGEYPRDEDGNMFTGIKVAHISSSDGVERKFKNGVVVVGAMPYMISNVEEDLGLGLWQNKDLDEEVARSSDYDDDDGYFNFNTGNPLGEPR